MAEPIPDLKGRAFTWAEWAAMPSQPGWRKEAEAYEAVHGWRTATPEEIEAFEEFAAEIENAPPGWTDRLRESLLKVREAMFEVIDDDADELHLKPREGATFSGSAWDEYGAVMSETLRPEHSDDATTPTRTEAAEELYWTATPIFGDELAAKLRDDFLAQTTPPPAEVTKFRTPGAALRAMPDSLGRRLTGIPTYDRMSRGGARGGECWTITGGPGSAKSATFQNLAVHFAIAHQSPVVAVHADEGDGPAAVRLGQMLGFDRNLLEAKDEETIAAFEAKLAAIGYVMADPDETTLEEAIAKLFAMRSEFPGTPVLLVDTVHEVRCAAADRLSGDRERVEKIVEVYGDAKRHGVLVLVAAEAVKGYYASKDTSKQTSGMAAPAETRKIAHKAEVLMVMAPTEDDTVFECYVPKNRLKNEKPRLHLRLDPTTARIVEVDAVEMRNAKAEKQKAASEAKVVLACEAILALFPDRETRLSSDEIHATAAARGKSVRLAALSRLKSTKALISEEDPADHRKHLWSRP